MSEKQVIISISREFGSGGRYIAKILAERFSLPLYDSNLLSEIAEARDVDGSGWGKYDEKPKSKLLSRRVKGYSNSPEENIAHIQFHYLKMKAEAGDSFVVLGRCSDEVLSQYEEHLVRIFILADMDKKAARVAEYENIPPEQAVKLIQKSNKKRKQYHNYYAETKWGDSRNYDVSVNSSALGLQKTADFLEAFIKEKLGL